MMMRLLTGRMADAIIEGQQGNEDDQEIEQVVAE